LRTEQAYVYWIRFFILSHGKRHPSEMGKEEVAAFLTHLVVKRNVSAATQNQALAALLLLYRHVLNANVGWIDGVARAKRPPRVPVVLSQREVRALPGHLRGTQQLVAQVLYGSGVRLLEGLRLRVKDLDFERGALVVRSGKGRKDRMSVLPESLHEPLQRQLLSAPKLHGLDVAEGVGTSNVPDALARKYPNAEREWAWQ
jgi:integrase